MFNINRTAFTKIVSVITLSTLLHGCAAVVAGTSATGAIIAQDRRTAGTIVDDKSIQLKAKQVIEDVTRNDPDVHISAICYNSNVLLVGQAPTKRIRTNVAKEIRTINKVRNVHNEITLHSPTSMLTRSSDAWITTKVKSEMAVTQDLNPTRIKVVTEDGVVYLMGLVNEQEEDIAVDVARHIKGVKKVVKIFERA